MTQGGTMHKYPIGTEVLVKATTETGHIRSASQVGPWSYVVEFDDGTSKRLAHNALDLPDRVMLEHSLEFDVEEFLDNVREFAVKQRQWLQQADATSQWSRKRMKRIWQALELLDEADQYMRYGTDVPDDEPPSMQEISVNVAHYTRKIMTQLDTWGWARRYAHGPTATADEAAQAITRERTRMHNAATRLGVRVVTEVTHTSQGDAYVDAEVVGFKGTVVR